MLRTLLGATLTALVVTLAPGAAPAAEPVSERGDPLAGLTERPEWGQVTGTRGVLRRGCRDYTFSYAITPPEGVWALEVFISGPDLERLASVGLLQGADATVGTGRYRLCKATTRYGRFTIQAKLSVDRGSGDITEGKLPPDHYRLHRPRR